MNGWTGVGSIFALFGNYFLLTAETEEVVKLDQWLIFIGIAQALIFLLQLVVFGIQARKLHQTVEAAAQQSKDMQESIKHGNRAADAMEKSAEAATKASNNVVIVTERTGLQMRAYLSVRINSGTYQDRATNVPFGVNPMLINTGLTPAYKVSYVARAAVLPFPLPDDFNFPPLEPPKHVFGLLAPQQNMIMNAVVEGEFFNDAEAEQIKRGHGRRTYIWGTVTYEDVIDQTRYTNFAHNIYFVILPDGKPGPVWGNYADRHNDAN